MLVTPSVGPRPNYGPERQRRERPRPAQPQAGAWDNDIVTVPVSDPGRCASSRVSSFSVDLDKVPGIRPHRRSRKRACRWASISSCGSMKSAPVRFRRPCPILLDSGFFTDTSSIERAMWAGRDGSFYASRWRCSKTASNTVQFSAEDDAALTGPAMPVLPNAPDRTRRSRSRPSSSPAQLSVGPGRHKTPLQPARAASFRAHRRGLSRLIPAVNLA